MTKGDDTSLREAGKDSEKKKKKKTVIGGETSEASYRQMRRLSQRTTSTDVARAHELVIEQINTIKSFLWA